MKKLLILKTKELVKNTASFEIIKTESEFEALLLEAKLINKFNTHYAFGNSIPCGCSSSVSPILITLLTRSVIKLRRFSESS